MNRYLAYAGCMLVLVGLASAAVAVRGPPGSDSTIMLASAEAGRLSGWACGPGKIRTASCRASYACEGKSEGDCTGACMRCMALDTDVWCDESCKPPGQTCEDLSLVSGGCGYYILNGTCTWYGACICDGPETEITCSRFRANSC